MLSRIRHRVRRWPGLLTALALVAFASQGVAATLAWCLHGGDDIHVTSAVDPCGDADHVARVVHPPSSHAAPCHDADGHVHTHMAHFSLATDAASGAGPALPAAAPSLVLWHLPVTDASTAVARPAASAALWPGGDRRPRLSGALPGSSTRLLI